MKSRQKRLNLKTTSTALGFTTASLFLPLVALAQVQITEIMYDAPGADSGREWIEITNTGSENVDVGKFKLFENGTNHGLTLVSGNALLAAGNSAILADDPAKFAADHPAFSGTVFNTAFSLSNTGETLVLKDESSTVLDTASYIATVDANGTGGSLHKDGSGWVAAMPNPGVYPGALTPVPHVEKTTPAPTAKTKKPSAASSTRSSAKIAGKPASLPLSQNAQNNLTAASAANILPEIPSSALWILALVAVILAGIAGVLFLSFNKKEISPTADEFKIE